MRNRLFAFLAAAVFGTAPLLQAQNPALAVNTNGACGIINARNNGNGGVNSCPGINTTPVAANVVGTSYATPPTSTKTGDIRMNWSFSNVRPPVITKIFELVGGTAVQTSLQVGPPGLPDPSGDVYYCFYSPVNYNLQAAQTLIFEYTDPQYGEVIGYCAFDFTSTLPTGTTANLPGLPLLSGAIGNSFVDHQSICSGGDPATISSATAAQGGTSPYTYEWQSASDSLFSVNLTTLPSSNTLTFNPPAGLTTTTYFRRQVTDATSATAFSNFIRVSVVPSTLAASISSQTNVACFGGATGEINGSVSGGVSPFTYAWNTTPAQSTLSATGLIAGTYTLTVTDAAGCSATAQATITAPASALTFTGSKTNVACLGGTTGTATAAASGGTAPYTYSWNTTPVQTTSTATGLAAGTYTGTVTDANGCTASTGALAVTQPASALNASTAQSNVTSNGLFNGSASVTAFGGVSPYTYSWNTTPAQTTFAIGGLAAGAYTCTVTDAAGCSLTRTVTITQPAALVIGSSSQTDILCFGLSTGSATVTPQGGTTPYTYSWNTTPAQTTATATGLPAGTYTVTVTDASGAVTQQTFTLTQPASAVGASGTSTNVACFGQNTGSLSATATGGTGPYSYSWNTTPAANTASVNNVGAGSYTCTITDANGCTTTANASVTQPASALTASNTGTNPTGFGLTNGTAGVTANGGTAPYTYSWNTNPVQTTANLSNLGAGTYICTITDANGCTNNQMVVLTQPSALVAGTTATTHVACFGDATGSTSVLATGGVAPYTYSWNTTPAQTTPTATGLTAGSYTCTVTDANGNVQTVNTTINQPAAPLAVTISKNDVLCFGAATGLALADATGGTGPYTYSWNTTPVQTGAAATNLAAGSYTVAATDAQGCTTSQNTTISEPASALSTAPAQTNPTGFGLANGSASVSASGGTAPYTYSWSPSGGTNATATGLTAGTYTCTVTDANGCTSVQIITLSQPAQMVAGISSVSHVQCFSTASGTASIFVNGGVAPYTYSWNSTPVQTTATASGLAAGLYTCSITDANGNTTSVNVQINQPSAALSATASGTNPTGFGLTNGTASVAISGGYTPYSIAWNTTPVQITANLTGLAAGTFIATVTDAGGCVKQDTVILTQPTALVSATTGQTNVLCFGLATGQASVSANGGTAPYTFSWNTTPVQTNDTATGLTAGTYTCTVTDANGNTSTQTVVILEPAAALSATATGGALLCFGDTTGTVRVAVTGGTGPYTYSWNTTPVQTNDTLLNLTAGTYTSTATDANGCTTTAQATVTQPATALTVSALGNNPSGNALSNGSASVTLSGGVSPYSVVWNTTPAQNGTSATNLPAGTYTATVTDSVGCVRTATVTLTQPAALQAQIIQNQSVVCYQTATGSASVQVSGGVAPYRYLWNSVPAQTTATATQLPVGTYQVTVLDTNNNSTTAQVTVTGPAAALNVSATVTNTTGVGNSDGSVQALVTGGHLPYSYAWNTTPVQTNPTATSLLAGTYRVRVTDGRGCVDSVDAIVANPYNLVVSFSNVQNVNCAGGTTGTATAIPSGGIAPYTFVWNTTPLQMSAVASSLAAGSYNVTVTDSLGASVTQSVTITQPAVLSATTSTTAIACYGGTGTATATPTGGTAPYTYAWNTTPIQTGGTATGLGTGIYSVTVTDANGCTTTPASVLLVAPNALTATATTAPATCFTTADGSASVTASGGTAPYTYAWNTTPALTTASISSALPLTYAVTITDANGCSVTVSNIAIGTTDYDCDGIPNSTEGTVDTDGDGTPDWQDTDSDNDGIPDSTEGTVDTDSDGTPDWRDVDSDNDGISDAVEGTVDTDGDGTADWRDLDSDNDGIPDATEGNVDTDGDGTPDFRDLDSDNDGISDAIEGTTDTDGDGTPDFRDVDSDNDGIPDTYEGNGDTDGDGTPDFRDTDADNDGILDRDEPSGDCDGDGIPNFQDPDACGVIIPEGFSPNNDGFNDTWEIRNLVYAPNNEVILVNRWGETVYRMVNYNNSFDGTPNRPTSGVSGDGRLPEGTYYFLFYDRTNNQQFDGYVFIAK